MADRPSLVRRHSSPTAQSQQKGPGMMSRFFGFGRALADSLTVVGNDQNDESDNTTRSQTTPRVPSKAQLQENRDKLVAFYTKHNPKKLTEVDYILKIFRGREILMFEALKRKYCATNDWETVEAPKTASTNGKVGSPASPSATGKGLHDGDSESFTVPPGATLMGVALQRGCSVRALRRLNPQIRSQSVLTSGQLLRVPKSSPPDSARASVASAGAAVKAHAEDAGHASSSRSSDKRPALHVPVEFCARGGSVHGSLLIAPDFVMFEPSASDVAVRQHGVLAYQFCLDMCDITKVTVVSHIHDHELPEQSVRGQEQPGTDALRDQAVELPAGADVDASPELKGDTRRQRRGRSFLQVFWTKTAVKGHKSSGATGAAFDTDGQHDYALFQAPRAAMAELLSTLQSAIDEQKSRGRRKSSINFTSDGGGMLQTTSLEKLFTSITTPFTAPDEAVVDKATAATNATATAEAEADALEEVNRRNSKRIELQRKSSCQLWPLCAKFVGSSALITSSALAKIDQELPPSIRGDSWRLLYSLVRDGQSFLTFLENCVGFGPTLVLVKSEYGDVFGGFASESWRQKRRGFFGTGECFLFRAVKAEKEDIAIWRWTGMNDDFMMCTQKTIAMGCAGESFGLHLGEDFLRGHSARCDTFGNEALASEYDFGVLAVEIWGLTVDSD